jgi:hypothetical protein
MAKRDLSRHQKKIVDRYYEHRDTIAVNKLGEIVSELYLTDSAKKQQQLWDRAATQLKHTDADEREVRRICEQRDLQALAQLVNTVT